MRFSENKSNSVKDLINVYDSVRRIFIKPSLSSIPANESDKESIEQEGQGAKIITPKQMITRFPILLAQIKAGNNSEKLKSEIRQLAYSFYR